MKTIVALVDFSDVTAKVLEQSRKVAKAFGSRLVILHGIPVPPTVRRSEADYNTLLDLRDSVEATGVHISVVQLEEANVKFMLERCTGLGAEMIVVGTHHHSTLYELIVGTFTGEVLKLATCPVLVVPGNVAQKEMEPTIIPLGLAPGIT